MAATYRAAGLFVLIMTILIAATGVRASGPPTIRNWLCYYGDVFGPEIYTRFDLVVLDSQHHPPLPTSDVHPPILGYLSVGEVDKNGPYWNLVQGRDFLVKDNQFWNSRIVDVRDPAWQRLLLDIAAPAIVEKGFDGFFLDTFDASLHLQNTPDGLKFDGTAEALVRIVKAIRSRYPDKLMAVNRGFAVLPDIAHWIDYAVFEDLYSFYNDSTNTYERVSADTRSRLMPYVERGRAANPQLMLLSIDYAAADQIALAREAIRFARSQGFIPYVSTVQLDQIFFHTLDR